MNLGGATQELTATLAALRAPVGEGGAASLTRDELLDLISSAQAVSNLVDAVLTTAMAHVAALEDVLDQHGEWVEQHRGLGHQSLDAPGLVSTRLGVSDRVAQARVADAVHQMAVTPGLVAEMASGGLDAFRAHVVTGEVSACPDDVAAEVVDRLVRHYADCGGWDESSGPVRARVRRLIARIAPEVPEEEARTARDGRCVTRRPATMGTDHWEAELPVEDSVPMWQAIDDLARRLRREDPTLTLSQARADALAQLVMQRVDLTLHLHATVAADADDQVTAPQNASATQSASPAQDVTSPQSASATQRASAAQKASAAQDVTSRQSASAAQGAGPAHSGTPRPGGLTEVGGLGPAPALVDLGALARWALLAGAPALTCHPSTGAVVSGEIPASLGRRARRDAARRSDGYVVPAPMQRLVRLRDGHCRFPNCSIAATFCDQDHVVPWPVGETAPTNLICLCRRHHRVKQRRGWLVLLQPDGEVVWTDPSGRVTTTSPVDHLDRVTLPRPDAGPTLSPGQHRPGDRHPGRATTPDSEPHRPGAEPAMPCRTSTEPSPAGWPDPGGEPESSPPSRLRALDLDDCPPMLDAHLRRALELCQVAPTPGVVWSLTRDRVLLSGPLAAAPDLSATLGDVSGAADDPPPF